MMILLSVFGFNRPAVVLVFLGVDGTAQRGGLLGFGAGVMTIVAGYNYDARSWRVGVLAAARRGFLLCRRRLCHRRALCGGSLAVAFETTGMGSAYGFGGIGQDHRASRPRLDRGLGQLSETRRAIAGNSAGLRLSRLLVLDGGAVYYFLGIETRGKSIEQIDRELAVTADLSTATASVRRA